MKLSSDQIEEIRYKVEQSGIRIVSLRDDVLDHLCCVIEFELKTAASFREALDKAIKELAPEGLAQLEHETVYLLNSKKIIRMKKSIYFIGFVGAVSLAVGTVFKWLHMPGADQLSMVGFLLLLVIFVPLAAIDRFKVNLSRAIWERLRIIFGALAAFTGGLAGIFKIYHLQGFDLLFFTSVISFIAGFLPLLFFTMYKKSVA
jgi:hypothetical protein